MLGSSMVVDLIHNAALLVALSAFYSLLTRFRSKSPLWGRLFLGLLFGIVALAGMKMPFHYAPGIIYDGRSIILILAGLYGGGTVAIIATLIAGIYRALMGGAGVWAGLATIVVTPLIGLFFRRKVDNHPERYGPLSLFGIGVVAHIAMLACQLLLIPLPTGFTVIKTIWLPIMLIFPATTLLIGLLLRNEEQRLVTQRKLEENQELLSKSQALGNVGSWEYDIDQQKLTCSEQAYRIFGVEPEKFEVSYENYLNVIHPDDRSMVDEVYRKSNQEGKTGGEIEHRIVNPSTGEVRYMFSKWSHIRNDEGRVVRVIGFVQDITANKEAENRLQAAHDRLVDVLESMNDAFVSLDRNWCYIYMNAKAGKIFGRDPKEMIGKHIWTEFPEGVGQPFHLNYEKAMKERVFIRMQEYYPPYNKWFENRIVPTEEGLAIFFTDVTERKKSEETLKQSEERFRSLYENATLGLYRTTPDGKILLANPALIKMLGYSSFDELARRNLEKEGFDLSYSRKHFIEIIEKEGEVKGLESAWTRRDGSEIYVRESARSIRDSHGKILYYDGTVEDITERKKVEIALRESETRFRAIVENSHDGILVVGDDFRFEYVNDTLCDILQYPQQEILGHDFREFLDEESKKLVADRYLRRRKGEKVSPRYEFNVVRKNGEIRRVEISSAVIKSQQGSFKTIAQIHDITVRKKAEEKARAANQQLAANNQQLIAAEQQLRASNQQLIERVKELDCFYGISKIVEIPDISLEDIFRKTVKLIPDSWQYPEIAVCRIIFDGIEYKTQYFKKTKWSQCSDIIVNGKHIGNIEICYLKKMPDSDKGPFLKEEKLLLDALAERLGKITESKQAEEEITKLSKIVETTSQYIVLTKIDGTVVYVNKAYLDVSGYKESEVIGNSMFDFTSEESMMILKEETIPKILSSGYWRGEMIARIKDGSKFPADLICSLIKNKDGKPEYFVAVFTDITERKQAELALQESEAKFHSLFSEMTEGVYLHEIIYNKKGKAIDYRIIETNPASEEILNIKSEDAIGKLATELYGTKEAPFLDIYANVAETGKGVIFEEYIPSLKKHFYISVYCPEKGKFATIFSDITERKRAEEQIKKNLAEKEVLIRELYHRTKNNMQVISSLLQLRARTIPDEMLQTAFREIETKIRSMALVHQKLYESQNLSSLNLKSYFNDLIALIRRSFLSEADEIQFRFDAFEDIPVLIDTAIPLGLILNELLTNAVKYAFPAKEKGEIRVVLKKDAQKRVIIEVSDNGAGFPEGFDVEKDSKLGLQTAIDLARYQLGGKITFTSKEGLKCRIVIAKELYTERV